MHYLNMKHLLLYVDDNYIAKVDSKKTDFTYNNKLRIYAVRIHQNGRFELSGR